MQTTTQMQVDTNHFLSVMDSWLRGFLEDPLKLNLEHREDKTIGFIKELFTLTVDDLHENAVITKEEYAACTRTDAHSLSVILYALPSVLMHEFSMYKMGSTNPLVLFNPYDSIYVGDIEDTLNINGKYGIDVIFNSSVKRIGTSDTDLAYLEGIPAKAYKHVIDKLITKNNITELFQWSAVNTIVLNYRIADILGVDFIRLIRKGTDSISNPLGKELGTTTQVLVKNNTMPFLGNYVIPTTLQDHITLNKTASETKAIFLEIKNYDHNKTESGDFEARVKKDPFLLHSLQIISEIRTLFPLVLSLPKSRDYSASMKSKYVAYVNEDYEGFNAVHPDVEKKSFFKKSN